MTTSVQQNSQSPSRIADVKDWIHTRCTTPKIIQLGRQLFSLGMFGAVPFLTISVQREAVHSTITNIIAWVVDRSIGLACPTTRPSKQQLCHAITDRTTTWEKLLPEDARLHHTSHSDPLVRSTAVQWPGEEIFHANYVARDLLSGYDVIASQYPPTTLLPTFWKMIFDRPRMIVDLTQVSDRSQAERYYPEGLYTQEQYGDIIVQCIGQSGPYAFYTLRDSNTQESKTITRLHYTNWQDGKAISVHALTGLVDTVKGLTSPQSGVLNHDFIHLAACASRQDESDQQNSALQSVEKVPLLIHCVAGLGRTGTCICALVLQEQLERAMRDGLRPCQQDVLNRTIEIILSVRRDRGPRAVMNEAQASLILDYGMNYLESAEPSDDQDNQLDRRLFDVALV